MAFASGIIHLVEGAQFFTPKTPPKKTISQKVACRVLHTPVESSPRLLKTRVVVQPDLDLSTKENLEGIIYPACINWTIENHLGKGKKETHAQVAWKAFQYTISNYSCIPRIKNSERENWILGRLFAEGGDCAIDQPAALAQMAEKLLDYPHLFDTFEGLLPFIGDGYGCLIKKAVQSNNIKALQVLDFTSVAITELQGLPWKKVVCDPLLEKIAPYLQIDDQLKFFDRFYAEKRWDRMLPLFQLPEFIEALGQRNDLETLRGIVDGCVEDSQYLPLLRLVLSLLKPHEHMKYVEKAREHGNIEAEALLLGVFPKVPLRFTQFSFRV